MSLLKDIYGNEIRDTIKSILFAVGESSSAEYKRGFLACAIALCFAFGINPSELQDIRNYMLSGGK